MQENSASPAEELEALSRHFHRLHTFKVKGPNHREVKQYLRVTSLFLPRKKGQQPLSAYEVSRYFAEQREELFPHQRMMNLEVEQKRKAKLRRKAMRQAA